MAAGLGFKDFTTGEVLTAADVDGYLMQGIWVFASAAARDAAVTSPQEGNFAFLKDTNTTTYYTGSAWTNLDTTGMVNPMTTTGDTIYSSSGSTPARLGIGTAGQVLQVNSGATAPEWATLSSGGGITLLSTTSLSGTSVTLSSISQDYTHLFLRIVEMYGTGADTRATLSINNDNDEHSMGLFGVQDTSATATGHDNQSHVQLGRVSNSSTLANKHFSSTFIYNYTSTLPRNIVADAVGVQGGSKWYQHSTGIYYGTSACSSLVIGNQGTTISGGTVYLYGVK